MLNKLVYKLFLVLLLLAAKANAQVPTLVFPSNNLHVSDTVITFSWDPLYNALKYELVISSDSLFTSSYYSNGNLVSNTASVTFPNQYAKYYWRVRAQMSSGFTAYSDKNSLVIFNPKFISNLKVYLRSDTGLVLNGSTVSSWQDMSGNGNHANQANAANQPLLESNIYNGKPAIKFDGADDFLSFSSPILPANGRMSVFVMFQSQSQTQLGGLISQYKSGQNGRFLWYLNYPSSGVIQLFYNAELNFFNYNSYTLFSFISTGLSAGAKSWINHSLKNTTTVASIYQGTNAGIGSFSSTAASSVYKGRISEIIIYDNDIPDTSRVLVEQYLHDKYAPPVNLGPNTFSNFCAGITLDAGNNFASYLWSDGSTSQSLVANSTGKYWVRVTDIYGTISSDTVELLPAIDFNQIESTNTICNTDTLIWNTNYPQAGYTFLWQDGSVGNTFNITQSGQYYVRIKDINNCYFYSDTVNVVIDGFSALATLGNDTTLCSGNLIGLTQGADPGNSYLWSTNETDSVISITTTGDYWLRATSDNGCIKQDTIHVFISGNAPVPQFSVQNVCLGDTAFFYDLSTTVAPDVIQAWSWDFGDGSSDSNQNTKHYYASAGDYQVTLIPVTNGGCSKVLKKQVTIYDLPVANFSNTLPCSGQLTSFSDASTVANSTVSAWSWDFGDVSSGTDNSISKNPGYMYDNYGVYNVQLIASSLFGCKDTVIKQVTVEDSPDVNFTFSDVCLGNASLFSNLTAVASPSFISKFYWSFGDGDTSIVTNPVHLYANSGTFNISLRAESSKGCADTLVKSIKIYQYPVADFSYSLPCLNQSVQFSDSSTIVNDSIVSWFWFFDDLNNSSLQNPQFTFADTGLHEVQLIVTSNGGCTNVKTEVLQQYPSPRSEFEFFPSVGVIGGEQSFINLSSEGTTYSWDFGNGSQGTEAQPITLYADSGVYTVSLISTNQYGCMDDFSRSISVLNPRLDLSASKISIVRNGNFAKITGEITNLGSVEVYTAELYLQTSKGVPLKENWVDTLSSGEKQLYQFSAEVYLPEVSNGDFICFKVLNPNGTLDENNDNDELCIGIGESAPILMDPFPSPANGTLNVKYLLPIAGNVKIEMFDALGNSVKNLLSSYEDSGSNSLIVDISSIRDGVYVIRLTFEGQLLTKRFIKSSTK